MFVSRFVAAHLVGRRLIYPGSLELLNGVLGESRELQGSVGIQVIQLNLLYIYVQKCIWHCVQGFVPGKVCRSDFFIVSLSVEATTRGFIGVLILACTVQPLYGTSRCLD